MICFSLSASTALRLPVATTKGLLDGNINSLYAEAHCEGYFKLTFRPWNNVARAAYSFRGQIDYFRERPLRGHLSLLYCIVSESLVV